MKVDGPRWEKTPAHVRMKTPEQLEAQMERACELVPELEDRLLTSDPSQQRAPERAYVSALRFAAGIDQLWGVAGRESRSSTRHHFEQLSSLMLASEWDLDNGVPLPDDFLTELAHHLMRALRQTPSAFPTGLASVQALTQEIETFIQGLDRLTIPMLNRIERGMPDPAEWSPLLRSHLLTAEGQPVRPAVKLLLLALMPECPESDLAAALQTIVRHAPELLLLYLALIGQHLRSNHEDGYDSIDLEQIASGLPTASKGLKTMLEASAPQAPQGARALIGSMTFTMETANVRRKPGEPALRSPDAIRPEQYLAHFIQWMTSARMNGVAEPEALIRRCFAQFPKEFPKRAPRGLVSGTDAHLGTGVLVALAKEAAQSPEPVDKGVWEWLTLSEGERPPLRENRRDSAAQKVYEFLRALVPPVEPSPEELATPRSVLDALDRRLPVVPSRPTLFQLTRSYLDALDAGHRDPALGKYLRNRWVNLFGRPEGRYQRLEASTWKSDLKILAERMAQVLP